MSTTTIFQQNGRQEGEQRITRPPDAVEALGIRFDPVPDGLREEGSSIFDPGSLNFWKIGLSLVGFCCLLFGTAGRLVAAEAMPKPVKVFILAGQSNMVGHGKVELGRDPAGGKEEVEGGLGSLRYFVRQHVEQYGAGGKTPLVDSAGKWLVLDNVFIHCTADEEIKKGHLTVGFGAYEWIGPEFGFGHVLGKMGPDPMLIIKTSWGGKSLGFDFRPPSSGKSHFEGNPKDEGKYYREMIRIVKDVTTNLGTYFPELAGRKIEFAGFGWHQGWNDSCDPKMVAEYDRNMAHLIKDVRKDLGVPNLPFVIADTGMEGPGTQGDRAQLCKIQMSFGDPKKHPEFAGTVASVETRGFARPVAQSPSDFGYHWNHNGESHYLVGEAMGQAMVNLLKGSATPAKRMSGPSGLSPLFVGKRNTFLVTVPQDATRSWAELAFLAAVPAGMKVNLNRPSVLALPPGVFQKPDRKYYDNYLNRYKPDYIYNIGAPSGFANGRQLQSSSLDAVTCELARFWKTSPVAVMVNQDDYAASLSASALAGRLVAPLFFSGSSRVSPEIMACLGKLGVQEVVAVGISSSVALQLETAGLRVASIPDTISIIPWLVGRGYKVDYFAVCNSGDRSHGYAPKSSLAAPLLAAARGGAVVPLDYPDSVFNEGCLINPTTKTRPLGAADSADGIWRVGECMVNGVGYPIAVSREWKDFGPNQANIDFNHNGNFGDDGEFIKRGQVRTFGGKDYLIDINPRRLTDPGFNKHWADVLFTYPTPSQVKADIQRYHDALGHHPKYMVMVGLPDVLPVALVVDTDGKEVTHFTDQFYLTAANGPYYDIAEGRFVGENASIFTLAASRAITYRDLLDDSWKNRMIAYGCFERDSKMHQQMFSNVGFDTVRNPKWENVDRAHYSVAVHDEHGWPFGFGPFTNGPSSPVFASTGGCSMGNIIDMIPLNGRISEYKDFGAVQLARTGAVGFNAFAKNATFDFELIRDVFLNAVLYQNATLGEAQLDSINAACIRNPANSENLTAPMFYGDPALRIYVPNSVPKDQPPKVLVSGSTVTVTGPTAIWRFQDPKDKDRPWDYSGPGLSNDYRNEGKRFIAAFTVDHPVSTITQTSAVPEKLGWSNRFACVPQPDGTTRCYLNLLFQEVDDKKGCNVVRNAQNLTFLVQ